LRSSLSSLPDAVMPRHLTMTFTTRLLTEAAHGGLEPPPTRRIRRANLHLSYSTTLARLHDTTRQLPDVILRICPWMLDPIPRRYTV
jgi:hypothetical protein